MSFENYLLIQCVLVLRFTAFPKVKNKLIFSNTLAIRQISGINDIGRYIGCFEGFKVNFISKCSYICVFWSNGSPLCQGSCHGNCTAYLVDFIINFC